MVPSVIMNGTTMQKFERVQVTKPRMETVYTEHKCDICKRDSPNPGMDDWNDNDDDHYRFDEIEITRKKGYSYPDDHWFELKQEVHICPECWDNVFLPWLKDNWGSDPTDVSQRYY